MKNIILLSFITLFLTSCGGKEPLQDDKKVAEKVETEKQTKTKSNNLNISILLDLSDRINPEKYPNKTMEFYQRDAKYISSVANAFVSHLKRKKVILLNDKMQLFFEPEPSSQEINEISNQLKCSFDRNSPKEKLSKVENLYQILPVKIYESAIADNDYVGSDIWRFFKDKASDYCVEKEHRNILVILTDGYIYHKNTQIKDQNKTSYLTPELIRDLGLNTNDWQQKMEAKNVGFLPTNANLENLEILVLGINPDPKNPFEKEVIKKYWGNWLKEMNIQHFELKEADLPSNLQNVINEFINE